MRKIIILLNIIILVNFTANCQTKKLNTKEVVKTEFGYHYVEILKQTNMKRILMLICMFLLFSFSAVTFAQTFPEKEKNCFQYFNHDAATSRPTISLCLLHPKSRDAGSRQCADVVSLSDCVMDKPVHKNHIRYRHRSADC